MLLRLLLKGHHHVQVGTAVAEVLRVLEYQKEEEEGIVGAVAMPHHLIDPSLGPIHTQTQGRGHVPSPRVAEERRRVVASAMNQNKV